MEQHLENMMAGGWFEFGSSPQKLLLWKGHVTGHIVMVQDPVVYPYFC
jgi:hypothetical protein